MKDAGTDTGARGAAGPTWRRPDGFVLLLSLIMLMGIGAMGVGMMVNAKHGQVSAQNQKNRLRAFYAADGINALLAQEVLDGNAGRYMDTASAEEIEGEIWENVPGDRIDDLRNAMRRPPTRKLTSTYLGARPRNKYNYGVRWKGYVIPPITGAYTFYVRADDAAHFFLSENEKPEKLSAKPIAKADVANYSWPQSGPAVSKPVALKAGKRYYFELLHKQGANGEGFGQVAWKGPNFLVERPIPGPRISRVGSTAENWDTASLANGLRVKYSLGSAGLLTYKLSSEAMLGGKGDTAFRAPLNQTLSLLGDTPEPPATIWQRVLLYDFHSDGSNPEFERMNRWDPLGVRTGMVKAKGLRYEKKNAGYFGLDSIGKPVIGASPKHNCGVDKWFTPWEPGWFKTYAYAGGGGDCRESPSATDRAFHNMVYKDSLQFVLRKDLGANVYQFKRLLGEHIPGFMPLDGKGFGAEGPARAAGRNYGFCMELHTVFEHTSGMILEFNGDDDVWVYINDSLVMDIGYVHASEYRSVVLDDLDLRFGKTYNLDFFYCERQSTGSSIDLLMNMPIIQVKSRPRASWRREYGELD